MFDVVYTGYFDLIDDDLNATPSGDPSIQSSKLSLLSIVKSRLDDKRVLTINNGYSKDSEIKYLFVISLLSSLFIEAVVLVSTLVDGTALQSTDCFELSGILFTITQLLNRLGVMEGQLHDSIHQCVFIYFMSNPCCKELNNLLIKVLGRCHHLCSDDDDVVPSLFDLDDKGQVMDLITNTLLFLDMSLQQHSIISNKLWNTVDFKAIHRSFMDYYNYRHLESSSSSSISTALVVSVMSFDASFSLI